MQKCKCKNVSFTDCKNKKACHLLVLFLDCFNVVVVVIICVLHEINERYIWGILDRIE